MSIPQIIVLYGPPAAGKGTQSYNLTQALPDRYHLDFGTELRAFVSNNIGAINLPLEIVNPAATDANIEVARRLKSQMVASLPALTKDLRYVIESAIIGCLERGQGMIIEGPGRLVEEAIWLSEYIHSHGAEVCIFHLYVSIDEVLRRAAHRYYLPGVAKPFRSFEDAMTEGQRLGIQPYRRPDDENVDGIIQRYKLLYSDNFAKIISIYQLRAMAQVFTVDGHETPDQVWDDIQLYLKTFCGEEI